MSRLRHVFLTAAMAGGMLLPSSGALARRHTCTGSIERGEAPFIMRKERRATTVNVPLLQEGHLRLRLPAGYMTELASASSRMPDPKAFISSALQANLGAAMSSLGSRRTFSFRCAELETEPPAGKPVFQPSPETKPPAKAEKPAEDGGRRRIMFETPAPKPKVRGGAPLMPSHKGGAGTSSSPYMIEVPVPSQKTDGTELLKRPVDARLQSAGLGTLHFQLRFVARKAEATTSRNHLINAISSLVERIINQRLSAAGKPKADSVSSLRGSIGRIVADAATYPDVKAYVR